MVAVYREGYLGSSTETVGKSSVTTYRLREILSFAQCIYLNIRRSNGCLLDGMLWHGASRFVNKMNITVEIWQKY